MFIDFFLFHWYFFLLGKCDPVSQYLPSHLLLPLTLSCQLKYIFSISLLTQTFQMDISASSFPPFLSLSPFFSPLTCLLLSLYFTISDIYAPLSLAVCSFICRSQRGVKVKFPSPFLSRIAGKSCLLPADCNCYFLQLQISKSSSPN